MPNGRCMFLAALVLAWTAAPAQAQWMVTPYLHVNFGDVEFRRGGPGVSVGYVSRRLGLELDVDRHHHFFKDKNLESVPNPCMPGSVMQCIDENTDAWIFMANVVAPIRTSKAATWRPYGTAGLGVIYPWIENAGEYNASQTNFAFNVGGGVMYRLNDPLALRGDVRYFHAFVDETKREGAYFKDYDFWRVAFGVTFRFAR
jgi:opacity protein-like surface antigen